MEDGSNPLRGTLVDLQATCALGHALGQAARPGDCIALEGGLGAGKTTLSRAVAESFGMAEPTEFASPTYTYLNPYAANRCEVLHFDFYRLSGPEDAYALGLDESLARTDALLLVEWADLVPELVPHHALWLTLAREGTGEVRSFQARGGRQGLRQVLRAAGAA